MHQKSWSMALWEFPLKSNGMHKSWSAHRHCVICGEQNPLGLKIHFLESGPLEVRAHWTVRETLQGYVGLLQGGVTAALLDSAMVNCLCINGSEAYTAEMCVRYLQPIPVGASIEIQGRIQRSRKNMHWTEAYIFLNSVLMASATAKFINIAQQMDKRGNKPTQL